MNDIFALNHYTYARWLSLHVDDLLKVEYTCPDMHNRKYLFIKKIFHYLPNIVQKGMSCHVWLVGDFYISFLCQK